MDCFPEDIRVEHKLEEFPGDIQPNVDIRIMRREITEMIRKREFSCCYKGTKFYVKDDGGALSPFAQKEKADLELLKIELEKRGFKCSVDMEGDYMGDSGRCWVERWVLNIDV